MRGIKVSVSLIGTMNGNTPNLFLSIIHYAKTRAWVLNKPKSPGHHLVAEIVGV